MTNKDSTTRLEDSLEAVRPGSKRMLGRLQSVSKELHIAVFSLNAGATLAFSGIYASLSSANAVTETPVWLLTAVVSFALGAAVFLGALALEAAVLRTRIWSDPSARFAKFLSCLDYITLYSSRGEWMCLFVGAVSVAVGFVGKLA
ncbi:MAG: hypothetical protein O7D29_08140 [Gemmatimonadetes bacterium]|nr:hypothetical protein [Gemmatimonadota bacterium]